MGAEGANSAGSSICKGQGGRGVKNRTSAPVQSSLASETPAVLIGRRPCTADHTSAPRDRPRKPSRESAGVAAGIPAPTADRLRCEAHDSTRYRLSEGRRWRDADREMRERETHSRSERRLTAQALGDQSDRGAKATEAEPGPGRQ